MVVDDQIADLCTLGNGRRIHWTRALSYYKTNKL